MTLEISSGGLLSRLHQLARIGASDEGGICRLALSDADLQARNQLRSWMEELDLDVRIDQIGNMFGLRAGKVDGPPVMIGSHIDSVAAGGRFDGAYGVMAGLEIVRTLNASRIVTKWPIVIAAFTNEEGVRFQPDMLGSLVYAAGMSLNEALAVKGIDGTILGDELRRIGYSGTMACGSIRPRAFVELHIEQGPILDVEQVTIGSVTNLQGILWLELRIQGQSNHAGTTPMKFRHDAGYCAAAISMFLRSLVRQLGGNQVGTVGSISLRPNLINVVAGEAVVMVDLRNSDETTLQEAENRLREFILQLEEEEGVKIITTPLVRLDPVEFDAKIISVIRGKASAAGYSVRDMTSGAGHDAQMMARICPAGMIFVPSVGGISHNQAEYTKPEDLVAGANVLLDTVLELANT